MPKLDSAKNHYWQGKWLSDKELDTEVAKLPSLIAKTLAAPLRTETLISAADRLAKKLKTDTSLKAQLRRQVPELSPSEFESSIEEVALLLTRDNLEKKLTRELGSKDPFLMNRRLYDENIFESWAPLGFITHISPQNSFATGAMSLLEGLLGGNINLLKTGGNESLFSQHFLAALADCDPHGELCNYMIAARISSKNLELLSQIFRCSDGIAAWGGEETTNSIKQMAPPHARLIEWGHRISFAYITRDFFRDPGTLEQIAREVCTLEQQACSSPQCLYLDTADWKELTEFAQEFSKILERISKATPQIPLESTDAAEITQVVHCHKMEACLSEAHVIESTRGEWRLLVDSRPALSASPLYRTLWIKPLPRKEILATLRPMRSYLQTVGLACHLRDLPEISRSIFSAGATRIRKLGAMLGGYPGEPHDGVYSLQRYCRRVSTQAGVEAKGISHFNEIANLPAPSWKRSQKVTEKENFVSQDAGTDLFFKSGGSSGEPKLSSFTYEQYDEQMWMGAQGLYAAGLDPLEDRAINLFFCGGLYGGFISIFSALERLRVKQFPMAAHPDLEAVGQTIVKNKINVLLGMPSYIMELFKTNSALLKKYNGVKKIFYGGEHFTESQKSHLSDHYGVELIQSGAYGSVDIGPMGYQCIHCGEGVHHLQQQLHSLEILKLEEDRPVQGEELGRLVFSPRLPGSNKPIRYAIGDVGHWVVEKNGYCPCGRAAPRFRLLGRTGDIFRIGTMFLNFQKFQKILSDQNYAGDAQIELSEFKLKEKVILRLSQASLLELKSSGAAIRKLCLENYEDLAEAVVKDKMLLFEVQSADAREFKKSPASGKLLRVIDLRGASKKS